MAGWTFLTYHARVLLLVAHDPGVRLRDTAASLNITERSAFGIITDLLGATRLMLKNRRYMLSSDMAACIARTASNPTAGPA